MAARHQIAIARAETANEKSKGLVDDNAAQTMNSTADSKPDSQRPSTTADASVGNAQTRNQQCSKASSNERRNDAQVTVQMPSDEKAIQKTLVVARNDPTTKDGEKTKALQCKDKAADSTQAPTVKPPNADSASKALTSQGKEEKNDTLAVHGHAVKMEDKCKEATTIRPKVATDSQSKSDGMACQSAQQQIAAHENDVVHQVATSSSPKTKQAAKLDTETKIDSDMQARPAALSAFFSSPSRLIEAKSSTKQGEKEVEANGLLTGKLSPAEISQKIASMLKPGPPFYSTVNSSDLIEHLSSESIMNGIFKSHEKKWYEPLAASINSEGDSNAVHAHSHQWDKLGSVWSNLDGLPSGRAIFEIGQAIGVASNGDEHKDDGLWSGIMFSCDDKGENAELCKSCVVPTHILESHNYFRGNQGVLFSDIGAGTKYAWDDWTTHTEAEKGASLMSSMVTPRFIAPTIESWSWPSWMPWKKETEDKNKAPDETQSPSKPGSQAKGAKRIWVPATDRVSVHARWWGFTIYIPERVMPTLDADAAQAEKIADYIYKILSGILTVATKMPFPAPLSTALALLKGLTPSIGYISTYIAWSWKELKGLDKGNGIELSATWILPVALIPRTWDAATTPADHNKDGKPDGPPSTPDAKAKAKAKASTEQDDPAADKERSHSDKSSSSSSSSSS